MGKRKINTEKSGMANQAFWSRERSSIFDDLKASPSGLTSDEAIARQEIFGKNAFKARKRVGIMATLIAQFKSPLVLLLLLSAILSFFLGEVVDGAIIITITFMSSLLGFWQERRATSAVEELLAKIQTKVSIFRDSKLVDIPIEDVVPGDIVQLSAGKGVPGDCLLLEGEEIHVNEATLTGETYPVEKHPGLLPPETPLNKRTNALFMGTNVVSGEGTAIVITTATQTEFGKIYDHLRLRPVENDFERGIRRFGNFLVRFTLLLVLVIFAVNAFQKEDLFASFLFALALAVGMTPDLLPAIVTITMSHGAKRMANVKAIVKKLDSIDNFGSMNVLCADKTGTLTEGVVTVRSIIDPRGKESDRVRLLVYLNSSFQAGYENPIDEAILKSTSLDISNYSKLGEIPYDFIRKRLSIHVSDGNKQLMVTKGALTNILDICSSIQYMEGEIAPMGNSRGTFKDIADQQAEKGYRVLGVAWKSVQGTNHVSKDDEKEMVFAGFIVLHDPAKAGIADTVRRLGDLGIKMKMITGDTKAVALDVGKLLGITADQTLTGIDLHQMSDEALLHKVNSVEIFSDMEPNQKERVILALKKSGKVVGYMGDGINDASAIHAADVGISVDTAVDVAKDAADIVLLEKNLDVLRDGVIEGRKTFRNTLKYIFITTSANFGNMITVAVASLILPFLPMLPAQILLTNLITDIPAINMATDNVDNDQIQKPGSWNNGFIIRFVVFFGLISSLFDTFMFMVLLSIPGLSEDAFRTAWFMESTFTELLIILSMRTRKPFYKSMPSRGILISITAIAVVTMILPVMPFHNELGLVLLPPWLIAVIWLVTLLYIAASELGKVIFYRHPWLSGLR